MSTETLDQLLTQALAARTDLLDAEHVGALRLFNGFLEGCPDIVIDLYAQTAVIHNYADPPVRAQPLIPIAQAFIQRALPWVTAILLKTRNATAPTGRQGRLLAGTTLAQKIREHGVGYALDLRLNQDASLYLDTRNLRRWALDNLGGKTVLNTFAYTGSLGVAAHAGGATRVVQMDLSQPFLELAKASMALNGWPVNQADFQASDFWSRIGHFKKASQRFDCVFVDPPLFAQTQHGRVDLMAHPERVINKVCLLYTSDAADE